MSLRRVLIAANDPGGANAVVPVAAALVASGCEVLPLLTGPACAVFAKRGIAYTDVTGKSESDLLALSVGFAPQLFFSGTSVGDSVDKRLLAYYRGKIPTLYIIDFWNNYVERFSSDGRDLAHMPDVICVLDGGAKETMLTAGFPQEALRVTGNPHFDHFTDGITASGEDPSRILYVSAPIAQDVLRSGLTDVGYDEFAVLEGIIAATKGTAFTISIRLHPRDVAGKYDRYLDARVIMDDCPTLETALSKAGIVIGSFSSVLLQALAAGKRVLSYQPDAKGEDPLISNRLGITKRATTTEALAVSLGEAEHKAEKHDLSRLFVPEATENVISVLHSLVL